MQAIDKLKTVALEADIGDIVLLNNGGIRSIISKGPISEKTAFELMPFENSIVVVKLKGSSRHF